MPPMPPPGGGMRGPGRHRPLTDEEKRQAPRLSGALLKRIFSYMTPYWAQLLLVMLIILVSAGLGLLPSILTGRMIDEGLIGANLDVLIQLILLSLLVTVVSNLVHIFQSYLKSIQEKHQKNIAKKNGQLLKAVHFLFNHKRFIFFY